jgi:hypothetical protein
MRQMTPRDINPHFDSEPIKVLLESVMHSANPDVPREKVFTILLPRAKKTLQITASIPSLSKEAKLFQEAVLGCHWE